jgi:hypothetical protein
MANRFKDLFKTLISNDKYDNETITKLSRRLQSCIKREEEQIDDNLYLKVSDFEDSEKMNIMLYSIIDLPHGQKVKNERNITDEEFLDFLNDLIAEEEKRKTGNSGLKV